MLLHNMIKAGAVVDDKPAIEDLFQSTLYSGTGSTSTITTGIDLSGDNAGMIWLKSRSAATDHAIYDTVRGATYDLASNTTAAQTTQATGVTGFGATGFSMGALAKINTNAAKYAAWTFKKAPKFFDVVQFTAGSSTNRRISHSLGCVPGMIVIRNTSQVEGWYVYHVSRGAGAYGRLDVTSAFTTSSNIWGLSSPTDVDFGLNEMSLCTNGASHIAYLWAHDDSADGVVQCGSFTTDASGNANTVNLGWEPQYLMVKASNATGDWYMFDTMRGMPVGAPANTVYANTTIIEAASSTLSPTATGFTPTALSASKTYIYLAIRRGPMRVPTDGTKVYNAIARTGTGAAATVTGVGFAVDAVICKGRSGTTGAVINDRLRGATKDLYTTATTAETTTAESVKDFASMDGMTIGTNANWNTSAATYINYCLRRAPGFFDTVCYTGTGVARTVAHGLKSVPGMIWVKCRNYAYPFIAYHSSLGYAKLLHLNQTSAAVSYDVWLATPTDALFSLKTDSENNYNGYIYTAYLFGDTPGLCKSFSYTGNGSNQDISLGFAPRFVLIKCSSATGDWKVFDSTRGIVSGNDPVLALNTTAAEVTTTDPIDPIATGFNITQEATNNLNVNAATYIGWSVI